MANLIPSWTNFFGIGKETTPYTGVVPQVYWSTKAKWTDIYEELVDEGYRGNAGADQVFYQGVRSSTFDIPAAEFYPDDWGHLLMSIMGQDTISGANPYTHVIGAASGLPPSYSITDFYGSTAGGLARRMTGTYIKKLDLKWVDNGKFTAAASFFGKASATQAKPTATFSALNPLIPWQGALTLNGSSNNKMRELNLSVERLEAQNVFGSAGTQDMAYGFSGALRVTGTAIFAITDETEWLLYANNTQGAFSLLLTVNANLTLTIQMTKCAFTKGTYQSREQQYLRVPVSFKAISNTTDISTGGSSAGPVLFTLKNAVTPAY